LVDTVANRRRQEAVEAFMQRATAHVTPRWHLQDTGNLERLAVRAVIGESTLLDLGVLHDSVAAPPDAFETFSQMPAMFPRETPPDAHALPTTTATVSVAITALCEPSVAALDARPPAHPRDSAFILEIFDPGLDDAGCMQHEGADIMHASKGIATPKVRCTRVFDGYVEFTRSNMAMVLRSRFDRTHTHNTARHRRPEPVPRWHPHDVSRGQSTFMVEMQETASTLCRQPCDHL